MSGQPSHSIASEGWMNGGAGADEHHRPTTVTIELLVRLRAGRNASRVQPVAALRFE